MRRGTRPESRACSKERAGTENAQQTLGRPDAWTLGRLDARTLGRSDARTLGRSDARTLDSTSIARGGSPGGNVVFPACILTPEPSGIERYWMPVGGGTLAISGAWMPAVSACPSAS